MDVYGLVDEIWDAASEQHAMPDLDWLESSSKEGLQDWPEEDLRNLAKDFDIDVE